MLSADDRRALEERAAGLRAERSSLGAERDLALQNASDSKRDAKLVAEVARLEGEVQVVRDEKNNADGTASDAVRVMNAAIESSGLIPTRSAEASATVDAVVADVDNSVVTPRIRPKGASQ